MAMDEEDISHITLHDLTEITIKYDVLAVAPDLAMTSEKYCSEKVVHVRHAHVSKNYIPLSWLRACYIHTHISKINMQETYGTSSHAFDHWAKNQVSCSISFSSGSIHSTSIANARFEKLNDYKEG